MRTFALVAVLVFLCTPAMAVSNFSYTAVGAGMDNYCDGGMELSALCGNVYSGARFEYFDAKGTPSYPTQINFASYQYQGFGGILNATQSGADYSVDGYLYVCDNQSPDNPMEVIDGAFKSTSVRFDGTNAIITGTLTPRFGSSIFTKGNVVVQDEKTVPENFKIAIPDWECYPVATVTMSIWSPDAASIDDFFYPTDSARSGQVLDVFTIEAQSVPEPLTLTATLVGLGLLTRKFRRRVAK